MCIKIRDYSDQTSNCSTSSLPFGKLVVEVTDINIVRGALFTRRRYVRFWLDECILVSLTWRGWQGWASDAAPWLSLSSSPLQYCTGIFQPCSNLGGTSITSNNHKRFNKHFVFIPDIWELFGLLVYPLTASDHIEVSGS